MRKTYAIHYGEQNLSLTLDEERVVYDLKPSEVEALPSTEAEIDRALSEPIDSPPLRDLVKPGDTVALLGDDATRLTPTRQIIPKVLDELNAGGVSDADITLVVATGTHRAMTEQEVEHKYGVEVTDRVTFMNHDCLDTDNLLHYGETRRGTDIWVNKLVMESDIRIGVGNIVPHHPTGWSGGAKILLPGVAGEHTTGQMHLLGATDQLLGHIDTPCRQEMEDFARATGINFIVNTILNSRGEVICIVAGHFISAHREGVRWGQKVFGVRFDRKSDLTLSSTYPVDHDLFQADKGVFSAVQSTHPGGEIILISPCHEGVSPTHGQAVDLAHLSDEELYDLAEARDGKHDPLSVAEVLYFNSAKKDYRITLVTEGISERVMAKLNFNKVHPEDLQAYLDDRLSQERGAEVGLIHHSTETLPLASQPAAQETVLDS